jgi:hypothetical protein
MADTARLSASAGSSIASIIGAKKAAKKLSSRLAGARNKPPPGPVSSAFWALVSSREQDLLNDALVDECRKRRARVAKAGQKV